MRNYLIAALLAGCSVAPAQAATIILEGSFAPTHETRHDAYVEPASPGFDFRLEFATPPGTEKAKSWPLDPVDFSIAGLTVADFTDINALFAPGIASWIFTGSGALDGGRAIYFWFEIGSDWASLIDPPASQVVTFYHFQTDDGPVFRNPSMNFVYVDPDFKNLLAAPEPATWAMMIGGFALVGAQMRRRTMVSFA